MHNGKCSCQQTNQHLGFRARRAARLSAPHNLASNPFIFETENFGEGAELEMLEAGHMAEPEDEFSRRRRKRPSLRRAPLRRPRRRPYPRPRPFPLWPSNAVLAFGNTEPTTNASPPSSGSSGGGGSDPMATPGSNEPDDSTSAPSDATTDTGEPTSSEPSDDGNEYFIGKALRSVSRAAAHTVKHVAPRPLQKAVNTVTRTAGQAVKGAGRAVSTVGKVLPVQQIADAAARVAPATPWGLAARAAYGGIAAAAQGKNVFQGATRSLVPDPGARFLLDTARGVAKGQNIWDAARRAGQAGIQDARERLRFAEMVAPFIPGVGTGIGAALGAANALANGRPITEAMVSAVRGALPGGALAQTAFDTAVNLARGKNIAQAALEAARARIPGGPAAKAAFDTAVALAQGKKIQEAVLQAGSKLLPPSPYSADAMDFARRVAAGQNVQNAALTVAGQRVMQRMQQLAPKR